jgi:hypothetical protein
MIAVKATPADAICCGCKTKIKGTGYIIDGRLFYELICRACVGELLGKLAEIVVQMTQEKI